MADNENSPVILSEPTTQVVGYNEFYELVNTRTYQVSVQLKNGLNATVPPKGRTQPLRKQELPDSLPMGVKSVKSNYKG